MKTHQQFARVTFLALAALFGVAQNSGLAAASADTSASLSPGAAAIEKLAQAGVSEDVIRGYIGQCQTCFNLSAADIVALESLGVSSQDISAMLNHDGALRAPAQATALEATNPPAPPPSAANPASPSLASTEPSAATATGVAPPPQPAPLVEVVPVAPAPDYIWAPGYWSWNGGVWIWVGGHWHAPVRPGHVWVHGYWGGHGHHRVWVGGHWR